MTETEDYFPNGALADMRAGKRVLVVPARQRDVRSALDEAVGALSALSHNDVVGTKGHYTNGQERVTHPSGGWIVFRCVRSSVRGLSCDVVYVADLLPTEARAELMLTMLTSEHPVLLRAAAL